MNKITDFLDGTAKCYACGLLISEWTKGNPVSRNQLWRDGWRGTELMEWVPAHAQMFLFCPECYSGGRCHDVCEIPAGKDRCGVCTKGGDDE